MRAAFRIFYFVSYIGFRFCESIIRLIPLDWAFNVGQASGRVAYGVLRGRRDLALNNLRLAFGGEMSDAELRVLNRDHFSLLGANLLAGIKASTMPHDQIWERVTADVPEQRPPSGWVALISHIGNWELFSHLGEKFPEYRFGAVYQGVANPYIDAYLRESRTRSGITLFDRRSELLRCVRFLREGGVVGVLVDQGAGYAGLWTPLFGRLTSSSTLAATLAIRTGLPVMPMAINTCGHARWKMKIGEPVFPTDDEVDLLTARINRLLEEQIREAPADWLWAHNRWKPLRPHFLLRRNQRRVFLPPGCDAAELDRFRILIVSPSSAEDIAASLPAVAAIAKGRPDNWLAVLAPPAATEIWRATPGIDHVVQIAPGDSPFALAARIRSVARFDAGIFFEQSWTSALAIRLAGVPIRVGRRAGLRSILFNQHPPAPLADSTPTAIYLQIARSVGADTN